MVRLVLPNHNAAFSAGGGGEGAVTIATWFPEVVAERRVEDVRQADALLIFKSPAFEMRERSPVPKPLL